MFVICGSLTASAVKVKVIAQIHCVKLWIHKILRKMSTALNQAMPPPEIYNSRKNIFSNVTSCIMHITELHRDSHKTQSWSRRINWYLPGDFPFRLKNCNS